MLAQHMAGNTRKTLSPEHLLGFWVLAGRFGRPRLAGRKEVSILERGR